MGILQKARLSQRAKIGKGGEGGWPLAAGGEVIGDIKSEGSEMLLGEEKAKKEAKRESREGLVTNLKPLDLIRIEGGDSV